MKVMIFEYGWKGMTLVRKWYVNGNKVHVSLHGVGYYGIRIVYAS